jgi:hypothetical protein
MRAYESKEKHPLFLDPLAEVLAGKRGMEAAATTVKVSVHLGVPPAFHSNPARVGNESLGHILNAAHHVF